MILKFTTKRDVNGNRYTLKIDIDNKVVLKGYNTSFNYSDYIETTKKEQTKLLQEFINNGYTIKYI